MPSSLATSSTPLPTIRSSSPSWEALVDTLSKHGILASPQDDLSSTSPCETVADLLQTKGDDDVSSFHHRPLLLVLVGGSWCAPCRNFTPVLKACTTTTTTTASDAGTVKVLFCSADHDEDSFRSYFGTMPSHWSAVPFDDDREEERDTLLEALNANSLPTLLVFDPSTGTLLESNAVHAVQAGGPDGFGALVEKWRNMAQTGAAVGVPTTTTTNQKDDDDEKKQHHDDDNNNNNNNMVLKYYIPAPPDLICQYFKERLLSTDLPEALRLVILRREVLDQDDTDENDDNNESAIKLADSIADSSTATERWLFRTAAPPLPMSWYGSSILGSLVEASALECWTIERTTDDDDDNNNNRNNNSSIRKATCTIENESGRLLLVFRETIVMEVTEDGLGTNVTKTLNLDGVPSMGHGPFRRRWKTESELIFHALLGSCDRKKK
ncbi:thioredoxin-like protein [Nitzschia inconspicua]|uniref:protein-disulfide reductase n=1 Tax=Nitzschia inconspicua TaxID=303405 RepID=A0A9K3LVI2_9STRA|nr:thioredoxin-like protein [Nitzschia inconspicua]KAG7369334.1 thioredoxin-like protein [Nitzschia inconspicua]